MKINLKKIREDKNITQTALAILVGTKQNYISEIESEKKIPSLQMLERIASALDVCVALLISDEKSNCNDCEKHKCTGGSKSEIKK